MLQHLKLSAKLRQADLRDLARAKAQEALGEGGFGQVPKGPLLQRRVVRSGSQP